MKSALHVRAAKKAEVAAAREKRQEPRIHPVLTPPPESLPLLGPPGTDPDGYPLQYVDRVGLRSLLAAGEFKKLTAYFEQLQGAFEADRRKEYWHDDAAAAFESAEPETLSSLDTWVAAAPDSFAPYLARGSHWLAVTWARRRHGFRDKTPEEDMDAPARRAIADFDHALALQSGLVAAMVQEMRAALSDRENPRFRALGGYPDFDRATYAPEAPKTEDRRKRLEFILARVDHALTYGEYWGYLYQRARALRGLGGRDDDALATLDRADALRPMEPSVLSERAALHANRNEWIAAGRDLLTALRIDPTEPNGKRYATDVLNGLMGEARASADAGRRDSALEAVGLVLDMCPDHDGAIALRSKLTSP